MHKFIFGKRPVCPSTTRMSPSEAFKIIDNWAMKATWYDFKICFFYVIIVITIGVIITFICQLNKF